jgi:hypothetical protein
MWLIVDKKEVCGWYAAYMYSTAVPTSVDLDKSAARSLPFSPVFAMGKDALLRLQYCI